jgi:hypothetical protein
LAWPPVGALKRNNIPYISFTFIPFFTSCSGIDINDEQAVMKDIQGTWIGAEHNGNIYRHIKLIISDNTFAGWYQFSESVDEPVWTVVPTENGTISLSSVQENPDETGKYRSINFFILHRCCGDNSLTANILSKIITYQDRKGLSLAAQTPMIRN